jgi:hypothetical protein
VTGDPPALASLRPVEPLPVVELDPDRVREHLAELEHERVVQQAVVVALRGLVDDAERAVDATDRRIASLRAHPAVQAALERDTP